MTKLSEALTSDELDRVSDFLDSIESEAAMDIEQLDGFFCALVAGPELVMPSEYYPHIFGGDTSQTSAFDSLEQAQEILALLMRHWNTIALTLNAGEVYLPIILEEETGGAHGNNWAKGFLQGVELRIDSWQAFLDDEDYAGAIIPMFALAHENHPDPKLRFDSPSPEKRNDLIAMMAAGVGGIYEYFKTRRVSQPAPGRPSPFVKESPEVSRNEPCLCGSGKKFKRCCGSRLN